MFARQNLGWIKKVSADVIAKSNLSVENYVKGIAGRTIHFDELCVLIACHAFNIHCAVLLEKSYWTTRTNNSFSGCLLRFAYMGDDVFKEINADLNGSLSEPSSYEDSDNSDLEGTGLLYGEGENETSTETLAHGHTHIEASKLPASNDDDNADQNDLPDMDIKPVIKFKAMFNLNNEEDPIVIDSDSDIDVKPPLMKDKFDFGTDLIVIDSDTEPSDTAPSGCATAQRTITPRVSSTLATASNNGNYNRIKRTRDYCCYLCNYTFGMQAEFVTHFKTSHPGSKFKCEFCNSFFDSANGLFKHECSHIYMKYECDACQKKFQFPYQLSAHKTQHTGVGKQPSAHSVRSPLDPNVLKIFINEHTVHNSNVIFAL